MLAEGGEWFRLFWLVVRVLRFSFYFAWEAARRYWIFYSNILNGLFFCPDFSSRSSGQASRNSEQLHLSYHPFAGRIEERSYCVLDLDKFSFQALCYSRIDTRYSTVPPL